MRLSYKEVSIESLSDSNGERLPRIDRTNPEFVAVYVTYLSGQKSCILSTDNLSQYTDALSVAETIAKIHKLQLVNNVPEQFRM